MSADECLKHLRNMRDISSKDALSDPFLFKEMQTAVDRIEKAIETKETIGIFGDYDADGVTGTAILVRALRRREIDPVVHLPDRMKEGYGMKEESVRALAGKGVSLLLTVDTGIAAHAEIALASELGIDTIVTDHHREQGGRPPAHAVIHPALDNFPNQDLSGSAVALMLVRSMEKGEIWEGIDEDIALAMIGTIGDVMPLTGENRLLVIHGLKSAMNLRSGPIGDLIHSTKSSSGLTSGDIAFRVVPRINAAGRIAHPSIALDALLKGGKSLQALHELNSDRQALVRDVSEELIDSVDTSDLFLCIGSDKITPGIAGLIAGKLTEKHGKPSLSAAFIGDTATASLRSIPDVDCMQCLSHESVQPLLITFGGHAQAAGCTFKTQDFETLRDALNTVVASMVSPDVLLPTFFIDSVLSDQPTLQFAESLSALSPFGQGNDEPLFLLKNVRLNNLRTVGKEHDHLQCMIDNIKAIGFRMGFLLEEIRPDAEYDCVVRVQKNEWNGRSEAQFILEDLRISASISAK